jgi:NAD(P)-dependent dehydrogenase (short-subunit alcohol dehydrogenase family)
MKRGEKMRLEGKKIIVSAAASGMGRAGCTMFAREGATVVAIDVNPQVVEVAKSIDGSVSALVADLSSVARCREVMAEAVGMLGGVDGLWNHVGLPGSGDVENLSEEDFALCMRLNIETNLAASGVVIPRMTGGGSIIFTSSVSGLVGSPFSPLYSTAKTGVVGLAKSLALRYAPQKIRVNAICPGPVDTPMLPQFVGRGVSAEQAAINRERLLTTIPIGRFGVAEDIAGAALWLMSDEASFVTGVALPVDGGYTAR